MGALTGDSTDPNIAGVTGENTVGVGVFGTSTSSDGVRAISSSGNGLSARSTNSVAIFAESTNSTGVLGIGHAQPGVSGISDSSDGVRAISSSGNGLSARSTNSVAIFAESTNSTGVLGIGHAQPGVSGISDSSDGVRAISSSGNGLSAFGGGNSGVGIFAQSSAKGGKGTNSIAGFFDGDVVVSGDVQLTGADFAEDFDIAAGVEAIDPGAVMVIHDDGALSPCHYPYDNRVAGVVSGAGDYQPGIILDKKPSTSARLPIALVGKVFCKVDAGYGPIHVGDMLTTSATPGHAMKAVDGAKAFGAVIGKALRRLDRGQDLIPILIALQ
jgi:hypothetical protein